MSRWLTLLLTFVLWLGVMAWVYVGYGPKVASAPTVASQEALASIFDENASNQVRWRIFMDPTKLVGPDQGPLKGLNPRMSGSLDYQKEVARWYGADDGEIELGVMEVTIRTRGSDLTRVERITKLRVDVPPYLMPLPFKDLGQATFETTEQITRDMGLEDFSARLKMGNEVDATFKGFREDNNLRMNIFFVDNQIGSHLLPLPENGAAMPMSNGSPFYYRPKIAVGETWEIPMLDLTTTPTQPVLRSVRAECLAQVEMEYFGKPSYVYEVRAGAEEDDMRAFYSPDGRVLKAHFKFCDLLPVTLVLDRDWPGGKDAGEAPKKDGEAPGQGGF